MFVLLTGEPPNFSLCTKYNNKVNILLWAMVLVNDPIASTRQIVPLRVSIWHDLYIKTYSVYYPASVSQMLMEYDG
jgi:hypothetical protein